MSEHQSGLLLRSETAKQSCEVRYREFWGINKKSELIDSLTSESPNYVTTGPARFDRFSLRPGIVSDAYQSWIPIDKLCLHDPFAGFLEARQGAFIDNDREKLEERLSAFYDATLSFDNLKSRFPKMGKVFSDYNPELTRPAVLKSETFKVDRISRYTMRPFDTQWCYLTNFRPLWNRSRPELLQQFTPVNRFLITRAKTEKEAKGSPLFFSNNFADYQTIARNVSVIPFSLRISESSKRTEVQDSLFAETEILTRANLSEHTLKYLESIGLSGMDKDLETSSLIWYHALAIGYSPDYLTENADGIRQDFPRIPLPAYRDDLIASAELGRRVAALLDTEKPVAGVTGSVRPELRTVGIASHIEGKQFQDDDFKVTAGWGHGGKDGVTMPGKGKVERRKYSEKEREAMAEAPVATALGTDHTLDIYLNNHAYWRNIPEPVWNYYIGGYQVIKKWLSYREFDLLGRPLNLDEVTEVTNMIRRIAALILMESELNENYQKIKAATYDLKIESELRRLLDAV